jgi:predicted transcriptional regulator
MPAKSPRYAKPSLEKARFAVFILMGMMFLLLAFSFPVAAQDEAIDVFIDENSYKADFTADDTIKITVTGSFEFNEPAAVAYFGIYAPEDWETSISPEEAQAVTRGAIISFEGEITPSPDASQKEHEIYVWASVDNPNPDPLDIISSTSPVFSSSSIIDIIKNRVSLFVENYEERVLPESTVRYDFSVTNIGTETDIFFIDLLNDESLTALGWVITQSVDNLSLAPGQTKDFYIEEQVPEDMEEGDYEVEVIVSSQGHVLSKESQTMTTKVRIPKVAEPFWFLGLALMVAFVGVGIGLATFFAATEIGYLSFISLFLPLYVRLKKKDVLSHFVRGQIYGYIQANPGTHYNDIIQHLGLHNGVGAYHLQVLEREGFIKSLRDGIYKRFYPTGVKIPEKKLHLSRIQRDILLEIQKHPGVTQKQISKLLDESKQVINYHVKVLESAGLIRLERIGRETACFAGKVRYVQKEDVFEVADEISTPIVHM